MAAPKLKKWQLTHLEQPQQEKNVVVKVRKSSWITTGEKYLYSIVATCLIIFGIYVVSYSSSTDTINREVQQLESKVQNQQVQNEGLSFEVEELSRPERITKIAKENGLKIQDSKVKKASAFND